MAADLILSPSLKKQNARQLINIEVELASTEDSRRSRNETHYDVAEKGNARRSVSVIREAR